MKNVLIVDDEPEVAHLLQHTLSWEDYGYEQPSITYGTEEALQLLENQEFDLLITDICMPGVNGLVLLERVLLQWPHMKRLVVSAFGDYEYIRGALRLGVLDYLLKPVDAHELGDIMLKLAQEESITPLQSGADTPDAMEGQFQEHFIYRWITASIAPYELAERLKMARITVTGCCMTVCALRIVSMSRKNNGFSSRELSEALVRIGIGNIEAFTCRESEDLYSIVLIIPTDGQEPDNRPKEIMQSLVHRLRLAYGIEVFIGVGRTVTDPQKVRFSYLIARRLVEHSILNPSGTIIDGKDSSFSDTTFHYLSRIDFDALHVMLRNGDGHGAKRFILQILQESGNPKEERHIDLNLAISEILVQTSVVVNRFGSSNRFPVDQWHARYRQVVNIEEFTKWVDYMVSEAIEALHKTGEHPIIKQMLEIMQESLSDSSLCLKTITNRIPLSATYLGQLFHQETGMLFTSCLADMRITEAKRLLSASQKRINEIADELGFNNQSYFNKVFKKHTGQTPAEYRRGNSMRIVPFRDN